MTLRPSRLLAERAEEVKPDGLRHRWRDCVADLPVNGSHAALETNAVRKSLGSGGLSHRNDAVLLRVEHGTPIRFRVSEDGVERPTPGQPTKPIVIPTISV